MKWNRLFAAAAFGFTLLASSSLPAGAQSPALEYPETEVLTGSEYSVKTNPSPDEIVEFPEEVLVHEGECGLNLSSLERVADTRVRVSNPKIFPYSAIAYVLAKYEGSEEWYRGTAFFVDDDTLVTAAHIIYDPDFGWVESMIILPGYSGSNSDPQTSWSRAMVHSRWIGNYSDEYDIGTIKVHEPLGYKTGSLSYTTDVQESQYVQTAGYPAVVDQVKTTDMWRVAGRVETLTDELVRTNFINTGGQSGSPFFDSSNRVIGVTCAADKIYDTAIGPRINTENVSIISDATDRNVSVYRLYNPNSGEHFFTQDHAEAYHLKSLGWKLERCAWYGNGGGIPAYVLYNPNAGDHHYTTDWTEVQDLINEGWRYEKVAFYVQASNTDFAVFRLYNPNAKKAGAHMLTMDVDEANDLIAAGWRYEGVAWYGV